MLPALKEAAGQSYSPPSVYKFACEKDTTHDHATGRILQEVDNSLWKKPEGKEAIHPLQDGQIFSIDDATTLKVLHTPGHTEDSASFLLQAKDGESVLFTADTVLGSGTAVFEDLKALLHSLERCVEEMEAVVSKAEQSTVRLFCGHGPVVEDGVAKCKEYIQHRLDRENQLVEVLKKADRPLTAKK